MLKPPNQITSFCIFIFLTIALQISFGVYPGNDVNNPLGFWGWYDQSQYLKQAEELFHADFSKIKNWVYPPGFSILSIPLALITNSKTSIILLSLTSLFYFMWVVRQFFSPLRYSLFLGTIFTLIFSYELFGNIFLVPWSTSITLLFSTIIFQCFDSAELLSKKNCKLFIIIISFLFILATRIQDFFLVLLGFMALISENNNSQNKLRFYKIIVALFVMGILWKFIAGYFLSDLYSKTQHQFLIADFFWKFLGIFNGDYIYGIDGGSIRDYSQLLHLIILYSLIYFIINANFKYTFVIFAYLLIYCSFSDFGHHNVTKYAVMHYFKCLFLITFAYTFATIGFNKKILTTMIFVVVISNLNIHYYNLPEKSCLVTGEAERIKADCDMKSGRFYSLNKFRVDFPDGVFQRYTLKNNGATLDSIKDFRIFRSNTGVVIVFFKDIKLDNFTLDFLKADFENEMVLQKLDRKLVFDNFLDF
jgi:hypothetical protein